MNVTAERSTTRVRGLSRSASTTACSSSGVVYGSSSPVIAARVPSGARDVSRDKASGSALSIAQQAVQALVGSMMQHLCESSYVGDERACEVHVSNVRRKIERDAARPERLVTVRGVGYKLVAR